MTRQRSIPIILLLGLLCFYSCGDDDKPTGSSPTVNSLPNAVGMLWVYEVYDSLTEITDTVWISVTDTAYHMDASTSLQWRTNWTVTDSVVDRYVLVQGDTIDIFSDSTTEPMLLERFAFPLSPGSEWTVQGVNDTSRVTDVGTVTVKAGTFGYAALVERSWDRDFEGGGNWSQTWVAPNVGVVSRYLYNQRTDGGGHFWFTVNQTWELLRYDLSTYSMRRFPNSVGTEWVYQVVHIERDLVDTVTVTIVSDVSVSWADSGKLWQYIGSEFTDTLYVGAIDEELFFSHSQDILYLDSWYYEFPLAVGRWWGVDTFAPIPEVYDKGPVSTGAGDFSSAFHYRMSGGAFNSYWGVEDWLVPGVGVVLRKTTQMDLGPVLSQDWTLISYNVP